jgi:type II secretory pathway pseudopilin PulG
MIKKANSKNKINNRKAFSLIEIVVALGILSACMVPIIAMMQSGNVRTSFNEYQIFVQIRAERIRQTFLSFPYRDLLRYSMNPSNPVPIPENEPPMPEEYAVKLDEEGYVEAWFFTEDEPGIGTLEITIDWKFPGSHELWRNFTLKTIITRSDLSLVQNYALN